MIGLGLLEAVPAADILALADPEDRDGERHQRAGERGMVGAGAAGCAWPFRLEGGRATIRDQAAAAFAGDVEYRRR